MKRYIVKPLIVLIIGLLFIMLQLSACAKYDIKMNVMQEDYNTIATISNEGDWQTRRPINRVVTEKCYLFKGYGELITFLDENNLKFYKDEYVARYNEEYFNSNLLIIYHNIDPNSGYQYSFHLGKREGVLRLTVNIEQPPKDVAYLEIACLRLYLIEVKKSDVKEFDDFNCIITYIGVE